ncbi:hypothetical protein A3A64_03490 [Candidatus Gottesmanbacteria bacterium RIFCSPLOWO2_01_FULL_48_11]|uniref:Uncharacterized protein n=2 Tax=Patescibacteria group TaxID=1783273 RepID=A0A1F6AS71_9BACT|nr:MAG: hypothetical protein UW86_C0004G0004 [Microgenomates group bacterium GW2011_GWA1_Microgenomates_45_10]KKU19537.1 MAG: hypothetical protein UX29_C0002G0010 [Parcubacteria group bacterium GW2011_GWA2_46_10]OGG27511.1 MAG: hypothetical protein A3A64_03490 [Candidatus Gottesmanbacteria bacterium RIFCSPLOWO2_01_FULL_48_11]OGY56474.1 MAG: hypothetical protein A2119_00045 [Candidatus Colwellbacteria bacterium GWA2_46_10]
MGNSSYSLISETIETGSVYYYEEKELSSSEPHYFIVLNINPRSEGTLILACVSSKVKKRKRIAKSLGFPGRTLVVVSPSEYPIFDTESVIDCNRTFERTIQSLADKLEKKQLKICKILMPKEIVQKLISGTLASNQTSEGVRKILLGI